MNPNNKGPLTGGTLLKQVSDTSHDVPGGGDEGLGEAVSKRNSYDSTARKDLYQRRRFDPSSKVDIGK